MGTFHGGNCHTSVRCQVGLDGEKHYDDEWTECRVGGEQFFTDDRIGEFSVTFTVAEAEKCKEGLCRPIIKAQNFQDWAPIDAEEEVDKRPDRLCHTGKDESAWDFSEASGGFWWVCGVPNL